MRILAVMEALSLTGPAKNLLSFGQLARELQGTELILASYRRPEHPAEDDFIRGARALGIQLEILPDGGAWDLTLAGKLRRLCERLQVDLVQTHNVKSHFLFRLSGASRDFPWVAWNHGYTWPTWRQRVYNSFDYISLRGADRVTTVTGSFVAGLEGMGVRRERIEVVGNAIEVEKSDLETGRLRREDYAKADERIVLAVGRLSKEKAHQRLIEAIARLNKDRKGPAHVLLLVGDGPERQNLEACASAEGVRLNFAGQVREVRPYYALADVFVLPSDSEGSPNVLLEAMAEGLPIVSTNVGGVKETVNDGEEAVLVEPRNSKALSAALCKIADQPEEASRMGERARRRVIEERSPERRAQHILRIYEDLLKERTSK